MYNRLDPLGAALGLPPRSAEGRQQWILGALGQQVNVAAFSQDGEVVGHCFLAADKPSSAEIAVFVRQEFRRIGIGTALLKKTLEWGWTEGLARAWAITPSDNRVSLRLLTRCGFRLTRADVEAVELEIDLRVSPDTSELGRDLCSPGNRGQAPAFEEGLQNVRVLGIAQRAFESPPPCIPAVTAREGFSSTTFQEGL
jgi:GNAT superfamily N-acetyltransferase